MDKEHQEKYNTLREKYLDTKDKKVLLEIVEMREKIIKNDINLGVVTNKNNG